MASADAASFGLIDIFPLVVVPSLTIPDSRRHPLRDGTVPLWHTTTDHRSTFRGDQRPVCGAVDLAIVLLCGAIGPLMMGMIVLATTKGRRRPFSRRLAVRRGGVWRADLSGRSEE